jgi:ATP-dependent DNA ligase
VRRAMLADHTLDGGDAAALNLLTFPKLVLPKYDGVRIHIDNGKVKSRTGKLIPNRFLQRELSALPSGLEGEIVVNGNFADTTSAVRSHDKEGFDFKLYLFDDSDFLGVYQDRLLSLYTTIWDMDDKRLLVSDAKIVNDIDELLQLESEWVDLGMEGVIIRDPRSPYKQGRSTFKEQYYLSMKRYMTAEAKVVGYRCKMEGGRPVDTLGAFDLITPEGVEFGCGSGLTDDLRSQLWADKDSLIGKTVEFKYQKSEQVAPRFPVFLRFR